MRVQSLAPRRTSSISPLLLTHPPHLAFRRPFGLGARPSRTPPTSLRALRIECNPADSLRSPHCVRLFILLRPLGHSVDRPFVVLGEMDFVHPTGFLQKSLIPTPSSSSGLLRAVRNRAARCFLNVPHFDPSVLLVGHSKSSISSFVLKG